MHPHTQLRMHRERHFIERIGWLRAAVLGANDGIVSTASLILGVAAAAGSRHAVLTAGVAGLVAGAMAMAAGEFVSVSSQADTEQADWARERTELASSPDFEREELAHIYVQRGLEPKLARKVAAQLMTKDPLAAHGRDELGMSESTPARPIQAAAASALTFATGGALPLLLAAMAPSASLIPMVATASLVLLALLGAVGAALGGANILRASARVSFWGALAMGVTTGVGVLFGTVAA